MHLDTEGWSGEGEFTQLLIEVVSAIPEVRLLKVEDAPASRADAGFSFISNELFVGFETAPHISRAWVLGILPRRIAGQRPLLTLAGLETSLAAQPAVGPPDYSDEGMLQYLRTQRIIPAYQTRGYKLVELVRVYEAGTTPRREG